MCNANPALAASQIAFEKAKKCIREKSSFIFEAGAGAGKTYSLIQCLNYIISEKYIEFKRNGQKIACITYTNVAKDEIMVRTDSNPIIYADTIHSFCWSMISGLQSQLRVLLPRIVRWAERIQESGVELNNQKITYSLGYPRIDEKEIQLHHDDILDLTCRLLPNAKFRNILASRYPIVFIDEYQDTNIDLMRGFVDNFLTQNGNVLLGLFGDHWQTIYGSNSCGRVTSKLLTPIDKQANFRSVATLVDMLNRMRPELTQFPSIPNSIGEICVFHTNSWIGTRLHGNHWEGDLPADKAHELLTYTIEKLSQTGWDFNKTKILMLTHNILASEQGYNGIAKVFKNTDDYIKKTNAYIAYFADIIETICEAYAERKYGLAFSILGSHISRISSAQDKHNWKIEFEKLFDLRSTGNINDVLSFIGKSNYFSLPSNIDESEKRYNKLLNIEPIKREPHDTIFFDRRESLGQIPYKEVTALAKFITDQTPFSTNHGVKGAEFENVLVVIGRGWNNYNFNQMLEWMQNGVPKNRESAYVRNRNLFYVACSRPKKRLALLFTQELSNTALQTINDIFLSENVKDIEEQKKQID
jgi:DNA helicase-2/ATP-dependent DNA helicase PcrA